MEIITPRFMLREWQDGDCESLVLHANNPKIANKLRDIFPQPYTLQDAQDWVAITQKQSFPQTNFAIVVDNTAVGGIGLLTKDDVYRRNIEIGYWLGEQFWGGGIMTEAVKSICNYAFQSFDIVRIYAEVFASNMVSQKVLEKAGFCFDAEIKYSIFKNGRFDSSKIYSLLKPGFIFHSV